MLPSAVVSVCHMTKLAQVRGADSLNLSPDVYDSHRYTTLVKAVEDSKLCV